MSLPPPYPPPYGPPEPAAPPRAPGAPGVVFAGWGQRAAARLVDIVVVTIPAAVIGAVVGLVWTGLRVTLGGLSSGGGGVSLVFGIVFSVVMYLCLVGYDVVTVARLGRTFGKHVLKIQVVAAERPREELRIPKRNVLVRAALFHLWVLFLWANGLLIWGLLIASFIVFALWPLWDTPNRQGLHDKVARTVVVYKV